jgi:hypothetical protein
MAFETPSKMNLLGFLADRVNNFVALVSCEDSPISFRNVISQSPHRRRVTGRRGLCPKTWEQQQSQFAKSVTRTARICQPPRVPFNASWRCGVHCLAQYVAGFIQSRCTVYVYISLRTSWPILSFCFATSIYAPRQERSMRPSH